MSLPVILVFEKGTTNEVSRVKDGGGGGGGADCLGLDGLDDADVSDGDG